MNTDISTNISTNLSQTNAVTPNSDIWKDNPYEATVKVSGTVGTRSFLIQTNAPFAEQLNNPRTFTESSDSPSLETAHIWFDALYALALEEVRQCSVSDISDGAFNNGKSLKAPEGGYFQTGLLWKYVWTRDTSYSLDLGLAILDPIRALNSLEFKLSELREGGNLQIIQDTGSGGSYPISSDRVVWSFGARALLQQLQGRQREDFAQKAYKALQNTIEHDRQVIFDPQDGLYRGEQSFLDWREQSYPQWTAQDTVQIGMSKALSTNACHLSALLLAASLAGEFEDWDREKKYNQWADDLRTAIRQHLYLPDQQVYATFITTAFDFAPAHQYDLLGSALSILLDIANPREAAKMVSNYPHLPKGAPVIWPQQRDIIIYHNQAIWPFVTAYWLKAAKKVKNDVAVTLGVNSLIRGAALSLSNMENFDAVTGLYRIQKQTNTDEDEPKINSPRQLWSVAGYLSMVQEIFFGLSWTDGGMNISPFITRELRYQLFPKSQQLVLNRLPYKGHQLTIKVNLPEITDEKQGAYSLGEVYLNGKLVVGEIAESQLEDENLIEVYLVDQDVESTAISLVDNLEDYRSRYAPRPPIIEKITKIDAGLEISWNLNEENPDEVTVNIYRNGKLVGEKIEFSQNSGVWQDQQITTTGESPTYCYTLESVYKSSLTISQRAKPVCYWGNNYERVYSIFAPEFEAVGGNFTNSHGRAHYDNWGEPSHRLTANIQPKFSGTHGIQVVAGNGAGPIDTGVTCAVKHLQMKDVENQEIVADGYLMMPHLGADNWDRWLDSSLILTTVDLIAGKIYTIEIFSDAQAINMSSFQHYELYTGNGGVGGVEGASNYVNIAEIKLLYLGTTQP